MALLGKVAQATHLAPCNLANLSTKMSYTLYDYHCTYCSVVYSNSLLISFSFDICCFIKQTVFSKRQVSFFFCLLYIISIYNFCFILEANDTKTHSTSNVIWMLLLPQSELEMHLSIFFYINIYYILLKCSILF